MTCIAQKHGGPSAADPDRLERIAGRTAEVKRQGAGAAGVVSAMGRATDRLVISFRIFPPVTPERVREGVRVCRRRWIEGHAPMQEHRPVRHGEP
jgi:aspartokinase